MRASCVEYLLHGCWELSLIIKKDVQYRLHIHGVGAKLSGVLRYLQDGPGTAATAAVGGGRIGEVYKGPFMMDSNCSFDDFILSNDEREAKDEKIPSVSAYFFWTNASILDEDGMAVLVDNERFIDTGIQAHLFSVMRQVHDDTCSEKTLSFIYGSEQDKVGDLCKKVFGKIEALERQIIHDKQEST